MNTPKQSTRIRNRNLVVPIHHSHTGVLHSCRDGKSAILETPSEFPKTVAQIAWSRQPDSHRDEPRPAGDQVCLLFSCHHSHYTTLVCACASAVSVLDHDSSTFENTRSLPGRRPHLSDSGYRARALDIGVALGGYTYRVDGAEHRK